ncbi:hypothetical protein ACE6H2_000356 [Prunus campanulata]
MRSACLDSSPGKSCLWACPSLGMAHICLDNFAPLRWVLGSQGTFCLGNPYRWKCSKEFVIQVVKSNYLCFRVLIFESSSPILLVLEIMDRVAMGPGHKS